MNPPDDIAAALAAAAPRLGPFARQLHWHATVPSTNDVAARLADAGAAEGLVVGADAQSAGRGRHGRTWASPPGAGLYVSTVLRPSAPVAPLLTIMAGVAIADGIAAATGLSPQLKWPNDLNVDGRKLAGILAEGGTSVSGAHVVLGIGINALPAALPPEIAGRATSLEGELSRPVDRGVVLAECLAALALRYAQLRDGDRAGIITAWRARAASLLRRRVEWHRDGAPTRGVAENIDDTGALLVRMPDGLVRVTSGEVTWLSASD